MTLKVKVKSYRKEQQDLECETENGRKIIVDPFVNHAAKIEDAESMVGKMYEIEGFAFEIIANFIKQIQ